MDSSSGNFGTDRSRALRRTRHARHIPAVAAIDAIRSPYQLSAVSQLSRHASSLLQLTTIWPPVDGLGRARWDSPKRQITFYVHGLKILNEVYEEELELNND